MRPKSADDLVGNIPDPAAVRIRLGQRLREVELLRRLLRLAQRAEQCRELDQEADDAAN